MRLEGQIKKLREQGKVLRMDKMTKKKKNTTVYNTNNSIGKIHQNIMAK